MMIASQQTTERNTGNQVGDVAQVTSCTVRSTVHIAILYFFYTV